MSEPSEPTPGRIDAPVPKPLPGLKPIGSPVVEAREPGPPTQHDGPVPGVRPRAPETPPVRRSPPRKHARHASFIIPLVVVVILIALLWQRTKPLRFDHEWTVDREPVQTPLETEGQLGWVVDEFTIRPVAEYEIEALLLRKRRYRYDPVSSISPWDFALGWGLMSDADVLQHLSLGQSGRFYRYYVDSDFPMPTSALSEHSANVHILPANEVVERLVARMNSGDRILLRGKLVNVASDGESRWRSSLVRTDVGAGACEILWVEYAETLD
jgi:hypothetical protein